MTSAVTRARGWRMLRSATMRSTAATLMLLAASAWLGACGRAGETGGSSAAREIPPAAPEAHFPAAERDKALAEGRAVLARHQCTRCHTIDDLPPGARPMHCTSCHVFLKGLDPSKRQYKEIAAKYGEGILVRYQRNIVHLRDVPDLSLIAKRLRPEWIATFLSEPFDVRPVLGESMIRHKLSETDVRAVVRYFAAKADAHDPWSSPETPALPRPSLARINAGRTVMLEKGCGRCHTFGNVPFGATARDLEASQKTTLLAPNLRFARERMRPETVTRWITAPASIQPSATMPAQSLTPDELGKVVDFLFFGDPELGGLEPPVLDVKPAAHPVGWEEVKARVFGKVCVHCHMNDYEKDKGPGNKGGFGYAGVGLAMRTYESIVWGAIDPSTGERYSVLEPRPGSQGSERTAPIVAALLRRRVEAARDQVAPFEDHDRPHFAPGELAGMPLGLPAMSDEEIGIAMRWIADGCPGPKGVSGISGVYDGLLVPDGPIAKNQGCELRAPSKARPRWAIETEKKSAEADGK